MIARRLQRCRPARLRLIIVGGWRSERRPNKFYRPDLQDAPSGQRRANRLLDAERAGDPSKGPALAYVTPCLGPTAARPGVWQGDGKRSCVAQNVIGPFDEPRGFPGLCNTMVIVIARCCVQSLPVWLAYGLSQARRFQGDQTAPSRFAFGCRYIGPQRRSTSFHSRCTSSAVRMPAKAPSKSKNSRFGMA